MNNITLNNEISNHRSCLEAFAMKFTNNVEDANDLVQDTIIKAIRYHNLYKPGRQCAKQPGREQIYDGGHQ